MEAVQLDAVSIIAIVASGLLAIAVVKKFFKLDDRIEQLSKDGVKASAELSKMGLTMSNEVLACVISRDLTGAINAVRELFRLVNDPKKFRDHMKEVSLKLISELIDEDPVYAQKIVSVATNRQKLEKMEDEEEDRQKRAFELLQRQEEDAAFAARAAARGLVPSNGIDTGGVTPPASLSK